MNITRRIWCLVDYKPDLDKIRLNLHNIWWSLELLWTKNSFVSPVSYSITLYSHGFCRYCGFALRGRARVLVFMSALEICHNFIRAVPLHTHIDPPIKCILQSNTPPIKDMEWIKSLQLNLTFLADLHYIHNNIIDHRRGQIL